MRNADRTAECRVTRTFGQLAVWSPNGEHILFARFLNVIRPDGTGLARIAIDRIGANPPWFHPSRTIAWFGSVPWGEPDQTSDAWFGFDGAWNCGRDGPSETAAAETRRSGAPSRLITLRAVRREGGT